MWPMPGLALSAVCVPVVVLCLCGFGEISVPDCLDVIGAGAVRKCVLPAHRLRNAKSGGMRRCRACLGRTSGGDLCARNAGLGRPAFRVEASTIFNGQTECKWLPSSCGALFNPEPGLSIGRGARFDVL